MSLANVLASFIPGVAQAPAPAAHAPVPPAGIDPAKAAATVTAAGPGTAPNGLVPGAGAPGEVKDPLAQFQNLWAPPKEGEAGATGKQPLFSATAESMLEAARKQDFRPQVSEAQMAAINKGGPEAFNAMLEVVNDMSQRAYATSAHATTRLIEAAIDKSKFVSETEIGTHIKRNSVHESLMQENPLFSNPAVTPMIEGLKSQLIVKFPNATSQEITGMAQQYLQGVFEIFNAPAKAQQAQQQAKGSTDWSTFL